MKLISLDDDRPRAVVTGCELDYALIMIIIIIIIMIVYLERLINLHSSEIFLSVYIIKLEAKAYSLANITSYNFSR